MGYSDSHYAWLENHLQQFFDQVLPTHYAGVSGLIVAHGDKCEQYKVEWARQGIPFNHGVALYLLTRVAPYCDQVRDTPTGWVAPAAWVVANYDRFRSLLENCDAKL